MKKHPNLKEALLACLSFSVIGLFNLGFNWEERSAFVQNITWELQSQLTLTKSQTQKVMEINYEFYDAVSNMKQPGTGDELTRLISIKNNKIMKVLNVEQRQAWIRAVSSE